MKLAVLALSAALSATSSLVFAQAGAGFGAAVSEKSGAAVNGGGAVVGTTQEGKTTVGPGHDASTQGSGPAGATDKKGDATNPGGVMKK